MEGFCLIKYLDHLKIFTEVNRQKLPKPLRKEKVKYVGRKEDRRKVRSQNCQNTVKKKQKKEEEKTAITLD